MDRVPGHAAGRFGEFRATMAQETRKEMKTANSRRFIDSVKKALGRSGEDDRERKSIMFEPETEQFVNVA